MMNIVEIHYQTKEGHTDYVLASLDVIKKTFKGNKQDYLTKCLPDNVEPVITHCKPYVKEPVEQKRFSDGTVLIGVITPKEQEMFRQERRAKLKEAIEFADKFLEATKRKDQF